MVAAFVDVLIMLCRTISYRTSNGVLKFIALSCTFRMLNVALVMPRSWKMSTMSLPLQTLLALSYPRSDNRFWLSWIQLQHQQKRIQRKHDSWDHFNMSPHWLDQTVAEVPQRFVFVWSDAVSDHAFELFPGQQQTVVVQGEAGALSRTVLNIMGFIQHEDLARQVDIHLEKTQNVKSHLTFL